MDQIKKYAPLWGKWIPTECIGEGGFGSVYRVKDKNGIQKDCAVKRITLRNRQLNLPAAETLSPDDFLKLQIQTAGKSIREIELMDTLGAANNIVTIYDYEIFPSTTTTEILLRMELLTSLSSLMKTDTLDRSEIIHIGMDLCDALISCEKHQIIHRDIKPDNIFRDSEGHYKLGDFGLSRQITSSASASLRGFGGTPLYMAPEALTYGKKVSYKTDQYALGIILYQLLNNGKTPFCEDMADPFEPEESIQRKLAGEELPPPANENGKLWKIIRKACELEETKRYPSAAEMKQDLQKLSNDSKTIVKIKNILKTKLKTKPVLMVQEARSSSDTLLFHKFPKKDIEKVIFLNALSDAPDNAEDLSDKQNRSVLGWLRNNTLFIAGKNGVMANEDSSCLFYKCENLKKINFNNCFDTRNATTMECIFDHCKSLISLDVSGFNTSNVTGMNGMFQNCNSLTSLNISGFDTYNVTRMGWMFYGCSSLTSLDISDFDTSNVTTLRAMFCGCSSLTSLDVSGFDTYNVTKMGWMFYGCSSLTSLDVSGFNTSNVTDLASMFCGCSSLTSLDVSGFDTSNVTDMESMFWGCNSLTSLDVSGFDTSNVTILRTMFWGCSSLTSLDVSSFDTSNVTDMESMFWGCSSLTSLDVSGFNTSNVTDMESMFYDCMSELKAKCESQLKR